jgi:DNA mismatch repair protein MSH2
MYEFIDNDQYTSLDAFLIQNGNAIIYMSEEYEDISKNEGRKIHNHVFYGKNNEIVYAKKNLYQKKEAMNENLVKLVGSATHLTNTCETEKPFAYACMNVIITSLKLMELDELHGMVDFSFGSLNTCMRLDSAAAEAVNLLPKPDHPSQFGSIYGVLNRCKTKMGSRLLDRWLRQPLIDDVEINKRLDVVELLKNSTLSRNQLLDGPLKGLPDIDTILTKMTRKTATTDLAEVFRLYVFTRALPNILSTFNELLDVTTAKIDSNTDHLSAEELSHIRDCMATISQKFNVPLNNLTLKFALYQQLVEHVIDMNQLPDLVVNPMHDPELNELHEEQVELENKANKLLQDAQHGWASFCDIKLEKDPAHGFIFRTTKSDDERQLRANNSEVRVISIPKNGVHLTTTKLERIGDRYKEIDKEYRHLQKGLVAKTVETAMTYIPIIEAASSIVSEIDVLCSFAQAAAIAPGEYVRPKILPQGQGILNITGARHPCVELMDNVQFIANNYNLVKNKSSFQIITGPNMGGKSTYIRGIGSIVVMAQVGSFVPCSHAEISIIDCILARVGAGDAVSKGVSTFMAEMLEASVILDTATKDSLIIIDELGRGTSTFDGYGLAYAISEYMITKLDCLCLFATHFHELTALQSQHASVVNKHVTAMIEHNKSVVMLYQVKDGPCTQSYGVHVANTANFPASVIQEAKRKAKELENNENVDFNSEKYSKVSASMQQFRSGMTDESIFAMSAIAADGGNQLHKELASLFPRHVTEA